MTSSRRRLRLARFWLLCWLAPIALWAPICASAADTPNEAPTAAPTPALPDAPPDCPPTAAMPSPERVRTLVETAHDHGFLWRITKDGHSSWLYGTIHIAKLDWAFPGPAVRKALDAADSLALEMDPMDPAVQQALIAGMAKVRRPEMPEALTRRLERRARAECIPAEPFDSMAPEVRNMMLTSLVGRRDGIDPAYGIDAVLSGFAHSRKMPVLSLETAELQLKAIAMTSDEDSLTLIAGSLDEMEDGTARQQTVRLAQAWADGDLDTLGRYESWCHCVSTPLERSLMKRLLDDRNPDLAASIDALHASGKRVFAAVGSLHMTGPTGLPTLLRKRGYRVERITYRD